MTKPPEPVALIGNDRLVLIKQRYFDQSKIALI
jgi:hypothetical protein